jgi:hypothetical protein
MPGFSYLDISFSPTSDLQLSNLHRWPDSVSAGARLTPIRSE